MIRDILKVKINKREIDKWTDDMRIDKLHISITKYPFKMRSAERTIVMYNDNILNECIKWHKILNDKYLSYLYKKKITPNDDFK